MMDSRSTNRAMISVIERARGRGQARPSSRLFSVVLMAVFFIALMGGVAAGALMSRATAEAQELASELHLQSGLITNTVRGGDIVAAVGQGTGPEGPALVLTRHLPSGTYETRIYHYEGVVMQEFAAAGRPYDPRGTTKLLESDEFSFDISGDLVTFTFDQGSFCVALRSGDVVGQGGAS